MKIRRIDLSFDEFIAGTIGLSDVEMGIYWRAVLLIYNGGGRAHQQTLRRMCTSDPRVYKRVINALVGSGKLIIDGAYFVNSRCTSELQVAHSRSISASENVSKRWAKYRESKETADTAVIQDGKANHQPSTIIEEESPSLRSGLQEESLFGKEIENPPSEGKRTRKADTPANDTTRRKVGTRWSGEVPPEWIAEAAEIRANAKLPPINAELTAQHFADFWLAKPGRDGTKLDWHATWRNWVRNTNANRMPQIVPKRRPPDPLARWAYPA